MRREDSQAAFGLLTPNKARFSRVLIRAFELTIWTALQLVR